MYRKIDVFINGEYAFSSNSYRTCKELKNHIREVKHIEVASVPKNKYIIVNDYDKLVVKYGK